MFVFDQKLQQKSDDATWEIQVTSISNRILENLKKFLSQKENSQREKSDVWISNKLKTSKTKENKLFQKWIGDPSLENDQAYESKSKKNLFTIRQLKRHHKQLGVKPSSGIISRTLEVLKKINQAKCSLLDAKLTNKIILSVGPFLPSKLPETETKTKIPRK